MYLDYAAEIPDDVKVYIATSVESDRLMMTQVTGVLPAETGVIVRAKAGTYTFVESEDAPANVDGNLLSGTATDTYITAESGYRYYVLAQKEGMVGMFRPKLTDGRFLNNANKVYLPVEVAAGAEAPAMFVFSRGGEDEDTTGIDKLISNGEVVIYDLAGRRVEKMEKGIYIVNGKKVVK
jgi:hypothetical protein